MEHPMTSPPPEAVGAAGGQIYEGRPEFGAAQGASQAQFAPQTHQAPQAAPLPAAPYRRDGGARPQYGPRPLPPVHASSAQVELTLDLRATPPDKILGRLFGALDQVGDDVTLLVLLRDTPEYVGVTSSAYQALRGRGYFSDSSRLPQGGQRLRIQRRRDAGRHVGRDQAQPETDYVPAPEQNAELGGAVAPAGEPAWLPTPEAGAPHRANPVATESATGDTAPRSGALDPAKMAASTGERVADEPATMGESGGPVEGER